ncbi:MAG: hypothetical protein HRU11_05890 [Parvularculaceae bacterium]|nr:hypothetical protein [Parvularculaceae bacterium]
MLLDEVLTPEERLSRAQIEHADLLVAFMEDTDASLTLMEELDRFLANRPHVMRGRDPIDLWIKIENRQLGDRLAEYFGLTDLQTRLHPRFFSLEETSARRLWRQHPLDLFAEAQGQSDLHLCIYGFGALAEQIMTEAVHQSRFVPKRRLKITVLTDEPERTKERLTAWRPGLFACADIRVNHIPFHRVGISDADYGRLPRDATAHVICHKEPDLAAATALSLRRLLLKKPPHTDEAEPRRLNAPILVRFDRPTGIGQLLSGADEDSETSSAGWPDGVEIFGGYAEMLLGDMRDPLEPTVIDTAREAMARYIHLSYQAGVNEAAQAMGLTPDAALAQQRKGEASWRVLAPQFRDSCRQAADHLWAKARALDGRIVYAPKAGTPLILKPEEVETLTGLEHQRWVHERLLAGWSHSPKRVDAAKQHPNLVPYEDLPYREKSIDRALAERLDGALSTGHLALQRNHIVGVTGHRSVNGQSLDADKVTRDLRAALERVVSEALGQSVMLYSALAAGADSLAVEAAIELGIPYTAVLPLPFEVSRAYFEEEEGGIARFIRQTASASRVIELPLLFGDLAEVSPDSEGRSQARDQQFALAGGYIVRRCKTLLAVWDGQPARGLGGTGDVVSWARTGSVPQEYRLEGYYTPPAYPVDVKVIPPTTEQIGLVQADEETTAA